MGVDISDLIESEKIDFNFMEDKTLAIDAYNIIYQFLASIRQRDGKPLTDSEGRITSHLSGLLYRNANLIKSGIKPIYVFDGEPDIMKEKTLEKRKERKDKAKIEYKKSLKEGDLKKARKKAQQTSRMTKDIEESSKKLLDLLAIPWIQAPAEGESQAAHIVKNGDAWAVGSQDYDTLLFGTPKLVKNLTVSGRRKMPGSSNYKKITPELIELEKVLNELEITHEQLIDIGILCGTDYNEGIKGIGPKRGLKYVKKYDNIDAVLKEKGKEINNLNEIKNIFLNPEVTEEYSIKFAKELGNVKGFLCEERDFSESRVENALKQYEEGMKKRKQATLSSFD